MGLTYKRWTATFVAAFETMRYMDDSERERFWGFFQINRIDSISLYFRPEVASGVVAYAGQDQLMLSRGFPQQRASPQAVSAVKETLIKRVIKDEGERAPNGRNDANEPFNIGALLISGLLRACFQKSVEDDPRVVPRDGVAADAPGLAVPAQDGSGIFIS